MPARPRITDHAALEDRSLQCHASASDDRIDDLGRRLPPAVETTSLPARSVVVTATYWIIAADTDGSGRDTGKEVCVTRRSITVKYAAWR